MTNPAATVVLDCVVIVPTARPALTIAVVALVCGNPTTPGTVTSVGPVEMISQSARLYWSEVGAVSLTVTVVPHAGVVLVAR